MPETEFHASAVVPAPSGIVARRRGAIIPTSAAGDLEEVQERVSKEGNLTARGSKEGDLPPRGSKGSGEAGEPRSSKKIVFSEQPLELIHYL
jgi:hypothetical protein